MTWHHDVCIVDGSIVGVIEAGVGLNPMWWAYGCMSDWQDVDLRAHRTREEAKRAVEAWVSDNL